jgi:hypothetical protein
MVYAGISHVNFQLLQTLLEVCGARQQFLRFLPPCRRSQRTAST